MSFPIVFFTITATFAEAENRLWTIEEKPSLFSAHSTKIQKTEMDPTQTVFKVTKMAHRHLIVQAEVTLTALSSSQLGVNIQFITPTIPIYFIMVFHGAACILAIRWLMEGAVIAIGMLIWIFIVSISIYRSYRYDHRQLLKKITESLTGQ